MIIMTWCEAKGATYSRQKWKAIVDALSRHEAERWCWWRWSRRYGDDDDVDDSDDDFDFDGDGDDGDGDDDDDDDDYDTMNVLGNFR